MLFCFQVPTGSLQAWDTINLGSSSDPGLPALPGLSGLPGLTGLSGLSGLQGRPEQIVIEPVIKSQYLTKVKMKKMLSF